MADYFGAGKEENNRQIRKSGSTPTQKPSGRHSQEQLFEIKSTCREAEIQL